MSFFENIQRSISRAGPQHRANKDRYYLLKGQGWFLFTRGEAEVYDGIETNAGVVGPFLSKHEAQRYLVGLIARERPDLMRKVGNELKRDEISPGSDL